MTVTYDELLFPKDAESQEGVRKLDSLLQSALPKTDKGEVDYSPLVDGVAAVVDGLAAGKVELPQGTKLCLAQLIASRAAEVVGLNPLAAAFVAGCLKSNVSQSFMRAFGG